MRIGGIARWLMVIVPMALLPLSGCTTTNGFMGFLATTKGVDARIAAAQDENQKSLDRIDSEIEALQADVKQYKDQTSQIDQLLQQTQQLQKLASTVGVRLAALPRETLLQLSDLIQKALEPSSTGGSAK